ncbi:MarR family winged helix-turn-helix transcriptional regulator [Paracoccus sp. (in: a-proteobacteria)]|uniref:MarR family winged helix-turn-helix transcriptional regulator n=1 Tax=Paracoccus sp. TaxID=267 RepID=UPI003A895E19
MTSDTLLAGEAERDINIEAMLSFSMNHIVHRYNHMAQERLRSVGVSILQMRVVLSLKAHGQLSVGDLCRYAIAEQPTMSRALDRMENQRIVRRHADDTDSRVRLVTLTGPGHALFDRIHPEILRANARMTEGLSPEERTILQSGLAKVLANLER